MQCVRHASRYALPPTNGSHRDQYKEVTNKWLGGSDMPYDTETGIKRARAATMFLLGLPGSNYLYQ